MLEAAKLYYFETEYMNISIVIIIIAVSYV